MNDNWEVKKLIDVCNIQYGYAFDSSCFCEDNSYPQLIRIRDVVRGYSETFYKGYIPEGYYINKGDYLIGMDGEFHIAPWQSEKALLNQRVCKISASDCNVDERFIFYKMSVVLKQIEDETPFVTVKHLSAKRLNQVKIPIPPLYEQSRIVEELDLLSNIIEKKRQQLSELDNLAQSIFYDMFGDPVTNEKGWEVKRLDMIVSKDCPISYGIVQPGEDVMDGIPIVRPIDLIDTYVRVYGLKKTKEEISKAYKRTILRGDELLLCVRGTTGLSALATEELKGCNVTRGIVPLFFDDNNRWFIYLLLKQKSMLRIIGELTYGIALKQINIKDLRSLPIILPPLELQQLFAQKIEAIEKQKVLIKQSIAETEELFNSRMDYYFN